MSALNPIRSASFASLSWRTPLLATSRPTRSAPDRPLHPQHRKSASGARQPRPPSLAQPPYSPVAFRFDFDVIGSRFSNSDSINKRRNAFEINVFLTVFENNATGLRRDGINSSLEALTRNNGGILAFFFHHRGRRPPNSATFTALSFDTYQNASRNTAERTISNALAGLTTRFRVTRLHQQIRHEDPARRW